MAWGWAGTLPLSGVKYPTGLSGEMISKNWGEISKNVLLLPFAIFFSLSFITALQRKKHMT